MDNNDIIKRFEAQETKLKVENGEQEYVKELNAIERADKHISGFADALEKAKIDVAKQVTAEGTEAAEKVKEAIADTVVASAKVEQERVEVESDKISLQKDLLSTRKIQERYTKRKAKYEHLRQKRNYHFEGLKTILNRVGINEPTNIYLMYFVAIVILPFALLGMLFKGTIGNLLSGLDPNERAKRVKSFLITFSAIVIVAAVAGIVLWILSAVHII